MARYWCSTEDELSVVRDSGEWRIRPDVASDAVVLANDYLSYLSDRNYSPQTVRAYAFSLLPFCRWLAQQAIALDAVTTDVLLRFLAWCRQESGAAGSLSDVQMSANRSPSQRAERASEPAVRSGRAVGSDAGSAGPGPGSVVTDSVRYARSRYNFHYRFERSSTGAFRLLTTLLQSSSLVRRITCHVNSCRHRDPGGGSRSAVAVPERRSAETTTVPPTSPGFEVDELSVRFGGLLALDLVSFGVAPGEVVGLIGPNGAGKTTLFNAITGFVRPTRGDIRWNGKRLSGHRAHDLGRLGIARTLQGLGLCKGLTALENVLCGAQPLLRADLGSALSGLWRSSREECRIRGEAEALLGELGIGEWTNRLPGTLPYGVQKRVALARALISRPRLLLLDEPASGLSAADIDDLSMRIDHLRTDMSVLLVEHRMDFVMGTCDRIVVLNFGSVIAMGTPGEIQANPEVTAAYLGEAVPGSEAVLEAEGLSGAAS